MCCRHMCPRSQQTLRTRQLAGLAEGHKGHLEGKGKWCAKDEPTRVKACSKVVMYTATTRTHEQQTCHDVDMAVLVALHKHVDAHLKHIRHQQQRANIVKHDSWLGEVGDCADGRGDFVQSWIVECCHVCCRCSMHCGQWATCLGKWMGSACTGWR